MPAAIGRRGLLVGGGAAAGLAALTGCAATGSSTTTTTTGSSGTGATASASSSTSAPASPSGSAPGPTATAPTLVEAPRLADRLERHLAQRGGRLGLELVDLRRGEVFRHEVAEGYCYSTIKVLVRTTVLRQAQEAGKDLTRRQRELAELMITHSDNAATETLLAEAGRDEVTRVAGLVGMDETEIDEGAWALWRTVPGDLNRMVDAVLSSDRVLDGARRTVARLLMADVVPEQRWGVFAPESDTVHVAGKNGWGPLPDGYRLNTTGWVSGDDREYVLSILSTSPQGFSYGRRTISSVADLCHEALADGLA